MCGKKRIRVWPAGEQHHNAILSDHDALLLIELRREGYAWSWLSDKFEVSIATCRAICNGHRRAAATGVRRRGSWWPG